MCFFRRGVPSPPPASSAGVGVPKFPYGFEKHFSRASLPSDNTTTWRPLPPLNISPVLKSYIIHDNEKYSNLFQKIANWPQEYIINPLRLPLCYICYTFILHLFLHIFYICFYFYYVTDTWCVYHICRPIMNRGKLWKI